MFREDKMQGVIACRNWSQIITLYILNIFNNNLLQK